MGTYLVLVERVVVDHYHVEADSIADANEKFVQQGLDEGWPDPVYTDDTLEVEVREEETSLVEG